MKNRPSILALFLLLSLGHVRAAADSPALPAAIAPKDARIELIGRFDMEGEYPRCSWPGSAIVVRFRGTDLNLPLHDSAAGEANERGGFNSNYLTVRVDDQEPTTLRLEHDRERYAVAAGLAAGEHTVRVSKRTESFCGIVSLLGVELSAGGELLNPPPRPDRRIEFIGDSITCGYGNEAPDEHHRFAPMTENNDLAYGAITARRFGAEYTCIAWSGIGAYRNNNGDVKNTMETRYERTIGTEPTPLWAFRSPAPQVVVINLGTNDFSKGDPGENYVDSYKRLVGTVRHHYPAATLFFAVGSMLSPEKAAKNQAYLETVMADLNDPKIFFVSLGCQDVATDGVGADWHPSLRTHEKMADRLCRAIEEQVGWRVSVHAGLD